MPLKTYLKKVGRRVRGKVIKRYFKKGYNPKVGRIVKDVAMIKSMLNTEKKRLITNSAQTFSVGQVDAANSGHFLLDVTPNPVQGTGYNQKTGNSIKMTSAHYDFQFFGQTSNVSGMRIKMEWIQVIGQPFSAVTDILGKYIVTNTFLSGSIYDINSNRNPDYFKNYRVVRRKYVKLEPDSISGEINFRQVSVGLKLSLHIRSSLNDPTLSNGQLLLLITADRGNKGSTTSSITGIAEAAANTGANFNYTFTSYFVDN